jgi:hypothetical protein
MNPLNYATFEASQRLHAKGIVLETEVDWHHVVGGDWYLLPHKSVKSNEFDEIIPAPSMAEVWRELPEGFWYENKWTWVCVTKSRKNSSTTYCAYYTPDDKAVCGSKRRNINPTDALIDLLIWTVEQRKEEV